MNLYGDFDATANDYDNFERWAQRRLRRARSAALAAISPTLLR